MSPKGVGWLENLYRVESTSQLRKAPKEDMFYKFHLPGYESGHWKACIQETSGKHWDRDSRERPEQERNRIPRRD